MTEIPHSADVANEMAPNAPANQILPDEAKSPIGGYELPTGYLDETGALHREVVVKEITGVEEDILASRKLPVYQRMQKILENCTVSIGSFKAEGNPGWPRIIKSLTVSDRLFLIIKIRTVSIGAPFRFKTLCPACGETSDQVVNLDDFKIFGLSNPQERFWKGKLPRSGANYVAKVQTGQEEEKLAKIAQGADMLSLAIVARLVELKGIQPVTLGLVKALSLADREHLRTEFKAHEGRVENEVDVGCPACDHEFKTEIDIGTPAFFFPSAT